MSAFDAPPAGWKVHNVASCGSCARCLACLDLASVKLTGTWYCSPACARGEARGARRQPAVPESWLYPIPRRFYRKRRPTELR